MLKAPHRVSSAETPPSVHRSRPICDNRDPTGSAAEAAASTLTTILRITRIKAGLPQQDTDEVAREFSLLLEVNGQAICRLQCSPAQFEELARGFLCTAGLLSPDKANAPVSCEILENEARANVQLDLPDGALAQLRENLAVGTGCGLGLFNLKGIDPLDCQRSINLFFKTTHAQLKSAMQEFQKRSDVYRQTGGCHSAAVAAEGVLIAFAEDIGRHNALDKAIGKCILLEKSTAGLGLAFSGRASFEIVVKAARAGIELIAAVSAPSSLAVEAAERCGITLCGFVRGDRATIYCHESRVAI
jgi:FdhD protein